MQPPTRAFRAAGLLLASLLLLFIAAEAHAQRGSNTQGIYLNVHLNGTSISYDEDEFFLQDDSHSGGGGGIEIGYGVTRLVTLYLGLNGSSISTDAVEDAYTLAHVDLGAQFNFGAGRNRAVPYADVALTARQATIGLVGDDLEIRGGGITLGGGLRYYLSRVLALDGGLALTFGTFSEIERGRVTIEIDDFSAVSARLAVGLSWYPMRR